MHFALPARRRQSALPFAALCTGLALAALIPASRGWALTPESPEVKVAVDKAISYLKTANENRAGGKALMGLAAVKNGAPETDPTVQQGVEAVQKFLKSSVRAENEVYTLGVSIIFLTNLDAKKYEAEIKALLDELLSRQKHHGGWGYHAAETGDTSMTQYAVLAMWEVSEAGIETPVEAWEKVTDWLLRTQDPKGSYGYQGRIPPPNNPALLPQDSNRHSMAAAGLGSLFICQDHLNLSGSERGKGSGPLPGVFERVEEPGTKSTRSTQPLTTKVNVTRLHEAQKMGENWMQEHYKIDSGGFVHYYLYALERYESFKEIGRERPGQSLKWYDDGCEYLFKTQLPDGSWTSGQVSGITCDTAFAVLFLLRSTRKSLSKAGKFGAGTLVGGRGMPSDATDVALERGRVVAKPLKGPAEELLNMIDDPNNPQYLAAVAGLSELALETDEEKLGKQQAKLRELAGGTEPEARIAAVKVLGRTRDLNNVPTLIYALSDPDPRVVIEARKGLELISRKFRGMGPPDDAPLGVRQAAIERWKAWYLSLRPDAEFEQ